jgi:2-dehydro-3-deoxyphosphooctonate aldolase (KDO 8-P synthase)
MIETIIAGPCTAESESLLREVEEELRRLMVDYPEVDLIFKTSFDKANRTSRGSGRGIGIDRTLNVLADLPSKTTTDVHEAVQMAQVAATVDLIQIPAFLCRQTDLIEAAMATGTDVNIKKGQFLSPQEAIQVYKKAREFGQQKITITERGTSFGYNNLVVDFAGVAEYAPHVESTCFDLTHSLQRPGGRGDSTGGKPFATSPMAKAAVASGLFDTIFIETHPDPERAASDKETQIPLKDMGTLLHEILGE